MGISDQAHAKMLAWERITRTGGDEACRIFIRKVFVMRSSEWAAGRGGGGGIGGASHDGTQWSGGEGTGG
jgi:hypothetical protein